MLVRLAWHCSGTYDKNSGDGGSNGATMRFPAEGNHGCNAGLGAARDKLQPIKDQFPGISYSDLWVRPASPGRALECCADGDRDRPSPVSLPCRRWAAPASPGGLAASTARQRTARLMVVSPTATRALTTCVTSSTRWVSESESFSDATRTC